TLLSGIYYLKGGGFSATGQGSLTGRDVLIYNAPADVDDAISLTGTGSVQLTPPTTGTYNGISIFQDRNSGAPISITGNGGLQLLGTIYAGGAAVKIT